MDTIRYGLALASVLKSSLHVYDYGYIMVMLLSLVMLLKSSFVRNREIQTDLFVVLVRDRQ